MSLVALCALFAAIGSACMPEDQFSKPIASASSAGAEPVVLNGAGGKIANPAKPADASAAAKVADEPKADPGAPVLSATPLPPVPAAPAAALAPADPAADDTPAKNADGYPNINAPPKEPASKLIPEDERARVIAELEALRKKDGGSKAKDGSDTSVAAKSGTKSKSVVKCADGTTAASASGCKTSQ